MEQGSDFHINFVNFSLTELSVGKEAQHDVFFAERSKQKKRKKIIQVESEAKAAKMLGLAVEQNHAYLKLRKLRALYSIYCQLTEHD